MASGINVLAELERLHIEFQWAGENEIKCLCPFHEDTQPSCNINVEKKVFNCKVPNCNAEGDIIAFISRVVQQPRNLVFVELAERYGLDQTKTINADIVEKYHEAIWEAKPLLKELYARGVIDADIREYRLGVKEGRITIPIDNEGGHWVNIRRYLPGAPGPEKMKNTKGHSKPRLWPPKQLQYQKIVICAGEVKAIVSARHLNKHGIGAICVTAGEGAWAPEFTTKLNGKEIWVMMDIDLGGQAAARKICMMIFRTVAWLGNVLLPLDPDAYPKGDVNDFIAQEKGNLLAVIEATDEWTTATRGEVIDEDPVESDLITATTANMAGRRVKLKAVVSMIGEAPYSIPQTVNVVCAKDQKECALCPVMMTGQIQWKIHPESSSIIEMVGTHRAAQREAIMNGLGIPHTCRVCSFDIEDFYNVEEARISPQLDVANRATERTLQPAICIGPKLELNETYHLIGRMHPHPKTQQSTLLISGYHTAQDALSTYEPEDLDNLLMFQPKAWTIESIAERLDALYDDLEHNITGIFQRKDIHLAVDLAYHSPLLFSFDQMKHVKGWAEVLIMGDSGQGKSAVACGTNGNAGLMSHYGLGTRVECRNATAAGLIGGLVSVGSKWFVSWGHIPVQDKRLIILEELKGLTPQSIGGMCDMRSSGIAEMGKIEKRRTHARTRIIANSNCRFDKPLAAYSFPIEAIRELIGSTEDIRRFDLALLVAGGDVDPGELNKRSNARCSYPHIHTKQLCRSLILWAWTRKEEDVIFTDTAISACLDHATSLCNAFTDAIPLIDRGSTRLKIARLSAALAARTFSTDETKLKLVVTDAHVEYLAQTLMRIYSKPTFGYTEFTAATKLVNELSDEDGIKKHINGTPFPRDFCRQITRAPMVDLSDIQDWTAWERQDAQNLLSYLVRKHALKRAGRAYHKTPPFIALLKHMLENGCLIDRPDYIPEKEF